MDDELGAPLDPVARAVEARERLIRLGHDRAADYHRRMATVAYPLVAAVVGALVYAFSSNAKLARIGEMLCFVGLMWTVYALMGARVHF